ncbi:hypothetical protein Ancab_016282 [Ancistrocladus abbreviatus]
MRREGLDAYDVRLMGGKLMLIKPPGGVYLGNEESGLVERWGDLVAIDAATKARSHLDVARLAVLTPIMQHISLSVTLKIDEDEFPIFIAEEGMTFGEKIVSWDNS